MSSEIKSISTLIPDILEVIEGKGGWDSTITEFLANGIAQMAEDRFSKEQEPRTYLSLSALGQPCERKLWYKVNGQEGEKLRAETLGMFFYGDILEYLVISLAIAAGHKVEGLQEKLDVCGVKGHGDCIIDGVVVDVKSASSYGFRKFATGSLKEDDPFGYISQLGSYLYGYKDDPRVVNKTGAAFLVVEKEKFKLCLDFYDLKEEVANKEVEVEGKKAMVKGDIPNRHFKPEPDGKAGNMKLVAGCSYCEFKKTCWPKARTFLTGSGPKTFTTVAKIPQKRHGGKLVDCKEVT